MTTDIYSFQQNLFHKQLGQPLCQGPPAPIPYIFKFEKGSLHLCGPVDGRLHRATSFDGPGLCIMEKVNYAASIAETNPPRIERAGVKSQALLLGGHICLCRCNMGPWRFCLQCGPRPSQGPTSMGLFAGEKHD